jgi:N-acetylmuramoyl-L-alanine amidase
MVTYAERHYGVSSARLSDPQVIVEHFTGGTSFDSAWNTFAANGPDLGELPGTCSHFIIDTDGTIYQLVPLSVMCRHTVGLNYTAFGIEDVGTGDAEVLGNQAQLRSMLRLTLWLMDRFHIELRNVIGHNESLTSPFHIERYAPWRCQTHQDWAKEDMDAVRKQLRAMAEATGVPVGPPATPVTPDC